MDSEQFFKKFGQIRQGAELPNTNTVEQNAELLAFHYDAIIELGHGLFLDFKNTPELEKPVTDCLRKKFGWILEKPFFIRKPDFKNN